MASIQIRNLWKRYGNLDVLKGLTLDVKDGEILVILGRSGVGKSVLLRQIIGIEKPDHGTIDVDGVRITDLKRHELYQAVKHMGMLFQGSALFDSMNIAENTAFYLKQHGDPITKKPYSQEYIDQMVKKSLDMVGLEGTEKKLPSDLSGGMRKRAGFARLMIYHPKIRLYDEPTTGLDPITSQQISELIVKAQNELKGTSIVVTHDINSALYIADRIALHQDGHISHIADPDTFMNLDDPIIRFLKTSLTNQPRKERLS